MIPNNLHENHILDRTDLAILGALQKDGRLSNVALAESVFLSPSPCLARVRRLEQMQYICGYGARLNERILGYGMMAFVQVTLESVTENALLDFKSEMKKNVHVIECHMVTGRYDYLLRVHYNDMELYRKVLEEIICLPSVMRIKSAMVVEKVKARVSVEVPISGRKFDPK